MPTRKQRRRELKSKRHEYEYVYVDDEGNEVEAPPEEPKAAKPAAAKRSAAPGRARRTPQPPSWQRAAKRAVLLGAVVFILFGMLNKSHNYEGAALAALLYTILFIPFTFMLDRFAYRRWQQREQGTSQKR